MDYAKSETRQVNRFLVKKVPKFSTLQNGILYGAIQWRAYISEKEKNNLESQIQPLAIRK
jgi:hypothetical protein